MKNEEIINSWKNQRNQIEVGQNFTEEVMVQIHHYEQKKRKPLFDAQRFVELISVHPLIKTGMVLASVVIGFVRVVLMLGVIFGN